MPSGRADGVTEGLGSLFEGKGVGILAEGELDAVDLEAM